MKIISILNFKGGVGKTTTAVNFAQILATKHDKKVLLIDADQQRNTTTYILSRKENGFAEAIVKEIKTSDVIYKTKYENLDVIPASIDLYNADQKLKEKKEIYKVKEILKAVSGNYDYCFIDLPPGINNVMINCLIASDEVIIPARADYFSLSGMNELKKQVENIRKINKKLKINGVLITHYKNNSFNNAIVMALSKMMSSDYIYKNHIRYNLKISESTIENKAINDYSCRSGAAIDYKRAVKEFLEM